MIRHALNLAKHSTFIFKIGAVLTRGGSVIKTGYNRVGHKSAWNKFGSIHAEEDACNGVTNLNNTVLYIGRVQKNGMPALAKPCKQCMSNLKKLGVKKIVYTTHNGITTEKIK